MAVIGVDDNQFGQRPIAFVVLRPSTSVATNALEEHVRQNLANYEVPRQIDILDALPPSSTGKFVRRDLQERVEDA